MASNVTSLKGFLITVAISVALSVVPLTAYAQTSGLTTEQVNAVIELLESFDVSEETVTEVRAILEGGGQAVSSDQCRTLNLSNTLYSGLSDSETDGEVSELQRFLDQLGHFMYPDITGYYGSVTEGAVQKYQAENNIVSSGSPETTGYGVVGPQTRESFQTRCDDVEEEEEPTQEEPTEEPAEETPEESAEEEEASTVSESAKSAITFVNPNKATRGERVLVHGRNLTRDVRVEADDGELSVPTNFYSTELVTFTVPEAWSSGTYQLNVTRPNPDNAKQRETVEFTIHDEDEEDTGSAINVGLPEVTALNVGDTLGVRGVEGRKEFTLERINPDSAQFRAFNDPCAGESCNTEPATEVFILNKARQMTFFDVTVQLLFVTDDTVVTQFKHSSTSPAIEATTGDDIGQININGTTLDSYIDDRVTSNPGTYTGGTGTSTFSGTDSGTLGETGEAGSDECGQDRTEVGGFCFSTSIPSSLYPGGEDPDEDSDAFEVLFLMQYIESLKNTQMMELDTQTKEEHQEIMDGGF